MNGISIRINVIDDSLRQSIFIDGYSQEKLSIWGDTGEPRIR